MARSHRNAPAVTARRRRCVGPSAYRRTPDSSHPEGTPPIMSMLYRLAAPTRVTWTDFPMKLDDLQQHGVDLDRLEWENTVELRFSDNLLRIALRHGVATAGGIALDALHTVDLGRSDLLRDLQRQTDELRAEIRTKNGAFFESIMPGWTKAGEELDQRARESSDEAGREADEDLAVVLAAPVKPELVEHWRRLGGWIPDEDDSDE